MTIVEIILQETCPQVVMASEMKVHLEDSTVDLQEEVASEIEEASGIEAASEVAIEIRRNKESSRKVSALIANNKVTWPEIALSREMEETVREVATSQESQEVT